MSAALPLILSVGTVARWSPFVQTYRFDAHRAVLLASIPRVDPWTTGVEERFWIQRDGHKDALIQVVQCRIPKAVDELIFDGQWVFARNGTTFVAIGSLKGALERPTNLPAPLLAEFNVVKVRQAKTALFVMVDDHGTFADFRSRAKAAAPTYDDAASSVTSVDGLGRPVTVRFDIHADPLAATDPVHAGRWFALPQVTINSVIQRYQDTPVYQTPFVNLTGGVLRLDGPGAFQRQGPASH